MRLSPDLQQGVDSASYKLMKITKVNKFIRLTNEIIYIPVNSLIFVIFTNLYDTESIPRCRKL